MRLRSSLAAGVAAAVTLVPAGAEAAAAGDPSREGGPGALRPTCAKGAGDGFPISTRISGGPATYERGGGFREWSLELTNTTDDTCGNVHPVIVLVDGAKSLKPRQIQLEYDDGARRRPVRFERTDRDETIGVLGGAGPDAGPGLTLAPGGTRTVGLRLAFTSDAAPGGVVASAAVVRRRDDDGDWVGASNDYVFDIVGAGGPAAESPGELAKTGPGRLPGLGVTAAALLLGGVALVVGSRRLRARGR